MIKDTYQNELSKASAIVYERNVIMNFKYKLMRDKNMRDFLSSLDEKSYNFENLEHMEKYYFLKNLKDVTHVLFSFKDMLKHSRTFKDRTSEDINKNCNVLPDSSGKATLFLLGHIPMLIAIKEKADAIKFFSGLLSDDGEKSELTRAIEDQEDFVLNSRMSGMIPREKDLTDFNLKNKKILLEQQKFEESRLQELNFSIEQMYQSSKEHENSYDYYVKVGMAYWDNISEQKNNLQEQFSEIINAMFKSIDEKKERSILKLTEVIKESVTDFGNYDANIIDVKVNSDTEFEILTPLNTVLSDECISNVEDMIIVRGSFEIYNVHLDKQPEDQLFYQKDNHNIYTFKCEIDID